MTLIETIGDENQSCFLDQIEENKTIQQLASLPPIPTTNFLGRKVTKQEKKLKEALNQVKETLRQVKILWKDYEENPLWRDYRIKTLWKDHLEKLKPEQLIPLKYATPIEAEQLRERDKDGLLLLTGASSNHYICLRQLLRSVQKYEPKTSVVVYDLGLDSEEREELLKVHNVSLKTFPFSSYPKHFKMSHFAGSYAWKPTIIYNENKTHRKVIWLDAGNLLTRSLDDVREALKKNGIMITQENHYIPKWTADKTFINLSLNKSDFKTVKMARANIIAFDRENPNSNSILDSWAKEALNKGSISPDEASLLNHRFDMSLLSLIMASKHSTLFESLKEIDHGITVHNDKMRFRRLDLENFLESTELTEDKIET
ncbi:hypothetical protein AB751O23_AG_00240 [Chlamydiales bacterium SCGC AB-751-O23]|nr:hypothetical protein AB751O23_AG_00240 [Chlamydiales bacterium SCGC AB-751-O23]